MSRVRQAHIEKRPSMPALWGRESCTHELVGGGWRYGSCGRGDLVVDSGREDAVTRVIGTARVVDRYPNTKTPPVTRDRWFNVIEREDEATLTGYVWLDVNGQLRHVMAQYLVFEPAEEAT